MLQNNISIIVPNYGYEAVDAKKKRIFLIYLVRPARTRPPFNNSIPERAHVPGLRKKEKQKDGRGLSVWP